MDCTRGKRIMTAVIRTFLSSVTSSILYFTQRINIITFIISVKIWNFGCEQGKTVLMQTRCSAISASPWERREIGSQGDYWTRRGMNIEVLGKERGWGCYGKHIA